MNRTRLLALFLALTAIMLLVHRQWERLMLHRDLQAAFSARDARRARLLLAKGAGMRSPEWTPALDWTVRERHADLTEALLKLGADPNVRWEIDMRGIHHPGPPPTYTPLFLALRDGDIATTEILLRHGADPSAEFGGKHAWTQTPVMIAASKGDRQLLRLVIRSGADLDAQDHSGDTALIHAARDNQLGATEELLAAGASTAPRNHEHLGANTALGVAVNRGHPEIAALLRRAGATR